MLNAEGEIVARGGNEFWTMHTEMWYLDGMAGRLETADSPLLYLPTLKGYVKGIQQRYDMQGLSRRACVNRAKELIKEFEDRRRVSL